VQNLLVRCLDLGEQALQERQYALAIAYFDLALEVTSRKAELYYRVASAFALDGDQKQALASLRAARREGFDDLARLRDDAAFASLREDPDFKALLSPSAAGAQKP
jgi:hypothetical protein